jgi:hypothetical protein
VNVPPTSTPIILLMVTPFSSLAH